MSDSINEAYRMAMGEEPPEITLAHSDLINDLTETRAVNEALVTRNKQLHDKLAILESQWIQAEDQETNERRTRWAYQAGFLFAVVLVCLPT